MLRPSHVAVGISFPSKRKAEARARASTSWSTLVFVLRYCNGIGYTDECRIRMIDIITKYRIL